MGEQISKRFRGGEVGPPRLIKKVALQESSVAFRMLISHCKDKNCLVSRLNSLHCFPECALIVRFVDFSLVLNRTFTFKTRFAWDASLCAVGDGYQRAGETCQPPFQGAFILKMGGQQVHP